MKMTINLIKDLVRTDWSMKCPGCGAQITKKDPREPWYCWNCKWRG